MKYKELTDNLEALKKKYEDVKTLKLNIEKESDLDEEDRTLEFTQSLEKEASVAIKITEEKIILLMNQYESLIKYFGDTSKEIEFESFFEIFKGFALDLKVY